MEKNPHSPETKEPRFDRLARGYFKQTPSPTATHRIVKTFLGSAFTLAWAIPALFYFRFQKLSWMVAGFTIFLVALCLLTAIAFHFRYRTEYHTPVQAKGDWIDKVGAFWMVACAFGPLLGWILTLLFPVTLNSWRTLYLLRFFLGGALPVITALPLTRYLSGKSAWVGGSILVVITALPLLSVWSVGRDLLEGSRFVPQAGWYLQYTERILERDSTFPPHSP